VFVSSLVDGLVVLKLGPDRFRLINMAAREALVLGGFVKEEEKAKGKGKK
jgi:hypothetical protein